MLFRHLSFHTSVCLDLLGRVLLNENNPPTGSVTVMGTCRLVCCRVECCVYFRVGFPLKDFGPFPIKYSLD